MRSTLTELKRALVGEVGMSTELEDLARALRNGQIPSSWRRLSPASRASLANWLVHFHQREEQYRKWVSLGNNAPI